MFTIENLKCIDSFLQSITYLKISINNQIYNANKVLV